AHKPTIRSILISQASYVKHKSNHDYIDLLRSLRDDTNAHTIQPVDAYLNTIADATKRINKIHLAKTSYTLQRLKMQHYSQSNKAGKALATLLWKRQAQSKI
ncbi:Hypothetical predicted protein, partial [Pelobates cultripes]